MENYKKYVEDMFMERYFERLNCKKDDSDSKKISNVKKVDFNNIFGKKTCFYPPCLNLVSADNYCSIHNKDMI